MCAVLEAVDKCFVFVGDAQAAAQIEHRIIIFQRQFTQEILQFFEFVADFFGIAFMGLDIGLVELVENGLAVTVARVKRMYPDMAAATSLDMTGWAIPTSSTKIRRKRCG